MRLFFYTILIILTASCVADSDDGMKGKEIAHISEVFIPETSNNLEIAQIRAKAVETNGCWSDLYFVMEKKSDFEYRLKAFGTYESNGVCPAVMVYKDTIINFKPTRRGIYFFETIQSKDKVRLDTMLVE